MQEFGANFSTMRVGELEVFSVDFSTTGSLSAGETIGSAVWTMRSADGSIVPAGMLPGPSAVAGLVCSAYVAAIAAGVFLPLCTVTTSRGQTITLPDPGFGQLVIAP